MTVDELEKLLEEKGYHKLFSSSLKRLPFEGFVLEPADNKNWIVYYTERGDSYEIARFLYEKDACQFVLDTLFREFPNYGFPPKRTH